jgi:hypothetical protein
MLMKNAEFKHGLGFSRYEAIKKWLLLLAGGYLMMLCACSALAVAPLSAHIQIDGLNRQIGEFVIALDSYNDEDLDIPLNDRYALRLDFKWLWNQDNAAGSALFAQHDFDESSGPPLSPWLTCKYRF